MKRFIPAAALMLAACAAPHSTVPSAAPVPPTPRIQQTSLPATLQPPQINGRIDAGETPLRASASYSTPPAVNVAPAGAGSVQGDISLDFADTDLRTVVDQILGGILHLNYTIDPSVKGTVTMRTVAPLSRDALIPTLQTLLAQNNAVLVSMNGIYRVMPSDQAASTPNLTTNAALGGAMVIPLHYAQAAPLAATLQPYITSTAKIVPASDQNALIVEGDPSSRQALVDLIEAFDVNALAGQSYELFPVTGGDATDFSSAFSAALSKSTDPSQPGPIRVVPLARMNAVLVIARSEALLFEAQRVYAVLSQVERETLRSWHIYHLHNSHANDAAYILQQAFTPDNVTAQPTPQATGQLSSMFANQSAAGGTGGSSSTGLGGTGGIGGVINGSGASAPAATSATGTSGSTGQTGSDQSGTSGASALLGPLSASGTGAATDSIRIIPDIANNALLIYATANEDNRISAMLDQIDIAPVEIRIDATIAEVDLNTALQYGTQFFFKSGDINAVLSNATTSNLATNFPGFVLSGNGSDAAPLAISLLQSVTKVDVLSSPELMVLDGQPAALQVGDSVPYLSQTSQSTLSANAPIVTSINYRDTGVILQVTPHVGTDGTVTLDVSQEVSAVKPNVTTSGINSPTFTERSVSSRISIADGQTIGLAGLIQDNDSHGNQGIPYLKNVPLLGDLFGSQNNQRTRTELLVLITPHVVRTQADAASLTADMREELPNAASLPATIAPLPSAGSSDPDAQLRSRIPP